VYIHTHAHFNTKLEEGYNAAKRIIFACDMYFEISSGNVLT